MTLSTDAATRQRYQATPTRKPLYNFAEFYQSNASDIQAIIRRVNPGLTPSQVSSETANLLVSEFRSASKAALLAKQAAWGSVAVVAGVLAMVLAAKTRNSKAQKPVIVSSTAIALFGAVGVTGNALSAQAIGRQITSAIASPTSSDNDYSGYEGIPDLSDPNQLGKFDMQAPGCKRTYDKAQAEVDAYKAINTPRL